LSIADPQALQAVHLNPRCLKGPWYQVLAPDSSVQTDRDASSHGARRKVWDRGFSSKALRNYEPRVTHYTDKLLARIDSHVQQGRTTPLDASLWFNFYSFDVMGDLSLGESFGMLDRGKAHFAMQTLHSYMFMLGVFSHVMWAFRIVGNLPIVGAENVRFKAWVAEQVTKRIEASHWPIARGKQGGEARLTYQARTLPRSLMFSAGSSTIIIPSPIGRSRRGSISMRMA
jgi:cytochrome P450 family 628